MIVELEGYKYDTSRPIQVKALLNILMSMGYDLSTSKSKGDDGIFGQKTAKALLEAKNKYDKPTKLLKKTMEQKANTKDKTMSLTKNNLKLSLDKVNSRNNTSGIFGFVNNPGFALLDKVGRGFLGIDTKYDSQNSLSDEHYNVLSDLSLYYWDNIASSLSTDIGKLLLAIKSGTLSSEEIESKKLTLAQKQNYYNLAKSGKLVNYLLEHPDEKVVIGGNFRTYKDANLHRFDPSIPTGYAGFDKPGYADYAMHTPLGQIETTFGNALYSYKYNPEKGYIESAMSDTYDFNPRGSENDTGIAGLRLAAGNSKYTGEGSPGLVTRRYQLKYIDPTGKQKNYITDSKYFGINPNPEGKPTFTNSVIDVALGVSRGKGREAIKDKMSDYVTEAKSWISETTPKLQQKVSDIKDKMFNIIGF